MTAQKHTPGRVELPYAVKFSSPHGSHTRFRNGTERRIAIRYFETKAAALAFCGDERRILYRPGEAWRRSNG